MMRALPNLTYFSLSIISFCFSETSFFWKSGGGFSPGGGGGGGGMLDFGIGGGGGTEKKLHFETLLANWSSFVVAMPLVWRE